MKALSQARAVPVVDLNMSTVEDLLPIRPAPTPEDFFLLRADGTVDGTHHFQERGARILRQACRRWVERAGVALPRIPAHRALIARSRRKAEPDDKAEPENKAEPDKSPPQGDPTE